MPLQAVLEEAAFIALPDTTVIGKDSFVKNEKENKFYLNLSGDEAGKLALPLQDKLTKAEASVTKLEANNKELLDQKIKFTKLGKTPEELEEIIKTGKQAGVEDIEKKHLGEMTSLKSAHEAAIRAAQDEISAAGERTVAIQGQLKGEMKRTLIAELKNKYGMNALGDDWLANRIQIVPEAEGSEKLTVRVFENDEMAYKGGTFKTPAQLVEEAKANKDLGGMFVGGAGGGGGSNPGQKAPAHTGSFINAGDKAGMEANLEDLASGKVKVV